MKYPKKHISIRVPWHDFGWDGRVCVNPRLTIMRGGDTDTNAAICGALLGAVCGREAIPAQWLDSLQNCRPEAGHPRVRHPRPECFWPVDVLELAELLILTKP